MTTTITTRANGSKRAIKMFNDPSRTEQAHRDRCNINSIMAKAHMTGMVPATKANGFYGDFTGATDYQTAQQRIMDAMNDFMRLPSQLRKRFHNNPGALLDFLADENNFEEAIELGLINPPEPPESTKPSKLPKSDGEISEVPEG